MKINFNNIYINQNNQNIINILNNKISLNKILFLENIKLKTDIDDIPYNKWKIIRSICSDYEIVGNNKIHQNHKIKEISTISRAYFKLLEILNIYENFFNLKQRKKPLLIDCLCEAPGGFIKCIYDYRNNTQDKYKTISIKDDKNNLIQWNIKNIKNLKIINGDENKNHNGNIYNPEILDFYIKSHNKKVDLVTADGGILLDGFRENYKSNYHINLFICELYIALKILKKNGIFILKTYELSTKIMVDFLIILNNLFLNVKINKPKTSREMNNEKYIICKNLKNNIEYIKTHLWNTINYLWNNNNKLLINLISNKDLYHYRYLMNIFEKIDYQNLDIQNNKLKYAIHLKNKNIDELKNILKDKKNFHFKNAYRWFKINNLDIS